MNKNTIKAKRIHQSSLDKWYSEIVSKDEKDYSIEDICRMLRQDYLIDRAVQIGIDYLKKDPFVGNIYNGELLSAFINDQKSYISECPIRYCNILGFIPLLAMFEQYVCRQICGVIGGSFLLCMELYFLSMCLK
jgi:hypothetical protein